MPHLTLRPARRLGSTVGVLLGALVMGCTAPVTPTHSTPVFASPAVSAMPRPSTSAAPALSAPPVSSPSPATITQEQAVAIARSAADWLDADAEVRVARQAAFGDVRNDYAPGASTAVPFDRLVWAINLFAEGMQQVALVCVDATDGRVIQVQRIIY